MNLIDWAKDDIHNLNVTEPFSAKDLIAISKVMMTGEYDEADEFIKLAGAMLQKQLDEINSLKSNEPAENT